MTPTEEATKRLVDEIWAAARDPKLNKDPAAVQRWRTYGVQKVEALIEAEVQKRAEERSER